MIDYDFIDQYIINSRGLNLANNLTTATRVNIYYHENCLDGACSAALLLHMLHKSCSDKPETPPVYFYCPVNYGKPFPMETIESPDTICVMVDFSDTPEVLDQINQNCKGLLVIDHHKSAVENILKYQETNTPGFGYVLGSKDHSGASLVHELFYDQLNMADTLDVIKSVVDHCRIHDTWRHNGVPTDPSFGFSTAIYSACEDADKAKASWQMVDLLLDMFNKAYVLTHADEVQSVANKTRLPNIEGWCNIGLRMLKFKEQEAEHYVRNGKLHFLQQGEKLYEFLSVQAPYRAVSLTGTVGYNKYPLADFVAIYEDKPESEDYVISLRSRKGGADVSEVARFYGGGGHAGAAGFKVSKAIWDEILSK